jgi:hypothetical protein
MELRNAGSDITAYIVSLVAAGRVPPTVEGSLTEALSKLDIRHLGGW